MVNHLVMQGRFVDDPTVGQTNSGSDYANFRIAWSEKYKDRETKCFLDCKAFSGTAKFVSQYFKKGQEILVEGKLTTDEWEKDGQKRSKIALVVSGVHFCGKRQDGGTAETAPAPAQDPSGYTPVDTDQLPF